jgi:protein TonB
MPFDSRKDSEKTPQESLGSLAGCLVEGDTEQRLRARRGRRRALVLSILIQTAVLGVLMLLPLVGKTQRIALAIPTPIPPYSPYKGASHDARAQHPHGQRHNVCHFCVSPNNSPVIVTHHPQPSGDGTNDAPDATVPGTPGGLISIPGVRAHVPPPPDDQRVARPTVVRMTQIDPAMLIYRVEPVYPPLAKQIRKGGRVELRAMIATDGTIQSLEIVGGDPIFYASARSAVSQWRYRPTILNGQPVEIDTHITIIYTMSY